MKSKTAGFLIALAGVFLFSAKAILVKLCYQYHVDTISVLTLRMGFSIPFFVVIGYFKNEKNKEAWTFKNILTIIVLGVLGYYGASYFDFEGLQYVEASLERLLLFLYPTMVVLMAALVFRKKINSKQLIAIGITYVGLAMIFSPILFGKELKYSTLGIILILLSACTYAAYLVASQYFVPKFGSVRFTTFAMIVSGTAVLVHYGLDNQADVSNLPTIVYVYGFIMAVFCTVLPSYLISEGIDRIGASTVSIIGSIGPISTISLSYFVLGESINWHEILGGAIIVSGVIWLNKSKP